MRGVLSERGCGEVATGFGQASAVENEEQCVFGCFGADDVVAWESVASGFDSIHRVIVGELVIGDGRLGELDFFDSECLSNGIPLLRWGQRMPFRFAMRPQF